MRYYRQHAPERLEFRLPNSSSHPPPVSFRIQDLDWPSRPQVAPAVAGLLFHTVTPGEPPQLVVSDMRSGHIDVIGLQQSPPQGVRLANLNYPCRIEPCDLDNSGQTGFLAADLGSFFATDHDKGRVIWLRPARANPWGFDGVVLAEGLGRVADVRVADTDSDGDQDILVAEFGHFFTGGILLLENQGITEEGVRFTKKRLDERPGTIHVPPLDVNGDQKPDFIALISNEWESVELFLNLGDNKFLARPIWRGPDLTFGSSGIELVDLDRDGDLDILYTNGDSFDNLYANPWHGVQWLENRGGSSGNTFYYHRLINLPGAYRAIAGDIDGDSDLDIVATAWLPQKVMPQELQAMKLPSVVLLEQKPGMEFTCHVLDSSWPQFPVALLADLDRDGDLDIVVGRHTGLDNPDSVPEPPLKIFWNEKASVRDAVPHPTM